MKEMEDLLREWLGLAAADRIEELACTTLPPAPAVRGTGQTLRQAVAAAPAGSELPSSPAASGASSEGLLDRLLSGQMRRAPSSLLQIEGWSAAWGSVRRWEPAPSIVLVDLDQARLDRAQGDFRADERLVVADTGQDPVRLHLQTEDGERVLWLTPTLARLFALHRAPSAEVRGLEQWEPPAAERPALPPPSELLQGCAADPWLVEETERLARGPSLLRQVAALGLAARLYAPSRGARSAAGAERCTFDERDEREPQQPSLPVARLRDWAASLEPATAEQIERAALSTLDSLSDKLEHLGRAVATEDPEAGLFARSILLERDDLEAVAVVLQQAGAGELLRDALAGFDEQAATCLDLFEETPGAGDVERLRQVSWQEPWAWWASCVDW